MNITDHYAVDDLAIKGSFAAWRPKRIIITCPKRAEDEFVWHLQGGETKAREDIGQLLRRIDVVIHACELPAGIENRRQFWYSIDKGANLVNNDLDGEAIYAHTIPALTRGVGSQ